MTRDNSVSTLSIVRKGKSYYIIDDRDGNHEVSGKRGWRHNDRVPPLAGPFASLSAAKVAYRILM